MTDDHLPLSDAELMDRLRRADPVVASELPAPGDPTPRQLLEDIMTTETPHPAQPAAHPAVEQARGRSNRRWGFLIASAAAVLFLVAGVLAFAPRGTEPALAAVHGAAAATADVDSGRITVTVVADGTDGQESGRLVGRVDAVFAGDDFSATIDVDEAPAHAGIDRLPVTESRLVDGTVYINDGNQWYSLEAPEFLGQRLQDVVDPRAVLETVQDLVETEEIGSATVDGTETSHYRSVVDLEDESLRRSGWLAMEGADVDAEGEVQIDLFVDGDGLLRQLDVSGDVRQPDGGPASATFDVSTTFTDLGADLSVEAPADATPVGPLVESLFDE